MNFQSSLMFSSSLTILTTQVFQSSFLSILVMQFRPERFSFFIDRTWLGCLPALPGDGASLRLADRPCGTWYAVDATNLSPLDVIDDMHAHRCTSTIHINTRYWMWNYVKWCEMMWMHEDSMKTPWRLYEDSILSILWRFNSFPVPFGQSMTKLGAML